jgi:hypothetical protein
MLLQTNSLTQISNPTPPLHLDAELTKATMLVRHVRSLLSQIVPHMTLRDYQISLYFHALKALTLPQKLNERQRLHTLMCAAILAETLQ